MTTKAASQAEATSTEATVPTLELLGRTPITYESALNMDKNTIHEAGYVAATLALYQTLWKGRPAIEALTRHHLGLGARDLCIVARPYQWIRGGFNICIPIEVQSPSLSRKLILRCAMPYKLADAELPGTVNEKVACEVGTYTWMQANCPEIPIPHLYGFGFSDHRHVCILLCLSLPYLLSSYLRVGTQFTHEAYRPWYIRVAHSLRRLLYLLTGDSTLLSRYTMHSAIHRLATAYVLLDNVCSDKSQMLSNTWEKQRGDYARRQRLFRGIAQLMVSLGRIP